MNYNYVQTEELSDKEKKSYCNKWDKDKLIDLILKYQKIFHNDVELFDNDNSYTTHTTVYNPTGLKRFKM